LKRPWISEGKLLSIRQCKFKKIQKIYKKQSYNKYDYEYNRFGYPAMAVVNMKKGKYSLFRGSFSEDGINELLRYV